MTSMLQVRGWLLAVLLSLLLSSAAARTLHAAAVDQTVTVVSTGEAHAQPDIALLTGGVEVSAATLSMITIIGSPAVSMIAALPLPPARRTALHVSVRIPIRTR